MSEIPLPWIKKVEAALKASDQIPFWGFVPGFPFHALAAKLKAIFQAPQIDLTLQKTSFLEKKGFFQGFGAHPIILSLTLTPLATPSFWIMSQDNVAKLAQQLLSPDHLSRGFLDHSLKEGFYYFICLKILEAMHEVKAASGLTIQLADVQSLPEEPSHAIDVAMQIEDMTVWGRWLCPESLQLSIREHFSVLTPTFIRKDATELFELPLAIEVGYTQIPSIDLTRLHQGDLLILDRCSLDPKQEKGSGQLTFNGIPLFQVRIKAQQVKIIDYAFFEEGTSAELEGKEETPDESLWAGEPEDASIDNTDVITLVVELGRLKMPLEHLLNLKPEAILELKYSSEEPVTLTRRSTVIGQAELVKIGEVLGAKILQIK